MGMESVYKLSVILNLVDNLSGQMNNVQSSVSGSVDKLNSAFGTMQKAGVAMAGIGGTITGLAMKTVTATFDTQNALEDMMALTRGEMNTLYRDSIIQVLSTKIDNYRKTDILQPSDDMVLEQDKVIMAGDINVTVRNVVQSARGKE